MADRSIFDIQAEFCKAMGNPIRLILIHTLREQPMVVKDLASMTELSQTMVSRQLATLRGVGVVECERIGTEMLYHLTDPKIGEVCDLVRTVLMEQNNKRAMVFDA